MTYQEQLQKLEERVALDRRRMEEAKTDEARAVWRAMMNLSQIDLARAVKTAGRVA